MRGGNGLGALLGGGLAVVFCCFASVATGETVWVRAAGQVTTAKVVAVKHGTKSDYVRVMLPEPADQEVALMAWSGRPRAGDTIEVRYVPSRPALAVDTRSGVPWPRLTLTWAGFLMSVLFCVFYIGRSPSRRPRGSTGTG